MNRKVSKEQDKEEKPRLKKQTVKDLSVKDPRAVKGGRAVQDTGFNCTTLCP
jgi:hypothetical protein